ncbi:hypothetical protein GCM10028792_16700 [Salinisphaera aquimarina]
MLNCRKTRHLAWHAMSATQTPDNEFFRLIGNGAIESQVIAQHLHVDKIQLADVLGVSVDSLRRRDVERAASVQTRLRDMIEIINQAQPAAGSRNQAFDWNSRCPPLAGGPPKNW